MGKGKAPRKNEIVPNSQVCLQNQNYVTGPPMTPHSTKIWKQFVKLFVFRDLVKMRKQFVKTFWVQIGGGLEPKRLHDRGRNPVPTLFPKRKSLSGYA